MLKGTYMTINKGSKRHLPHRKYVSHGGIIAQWLAYLLADSAAPCFNTSVPKKFSEEKYKPIAEVNLWRLLKESVEWPENVDQSHLVLASGKLVAGKKKYFLLSREQNISPSWAKYP